MVDFFSSDDSDGSLPPIKTKAQGFNSGKRKASAIEVADSGTDDDEVMFLGSGNQKGKQKAVPSRQPTPSTSKAPGFASGNAPSDLYPAKLGELHIACRGSVNRANHGALSTTADRIMIENGSKRSVKTGSEARLIREPSNPADPRSFRVLFNNRACGWLCPFYAAVLAAQVDSGRIHLTAKAGSIQGPATFLADLPLVVSVWTTEELKRREPNFLLMVKPAVESQRLQSIKYKLPVPLFFQQQPAATPLQLQPLAQQQANMTQPQQPGALLDPGQAQIPQSYPRHQKSVRDLLPGQPATAAQPFSRTQIPLAAATSTNTPTASTSRVTLDPSQIDPDEPFGFTGMLPSAREQLERQQRLVEMGTGIFEDFFSGAKNVLLLPEAPQPERFKTKLLKHQLQGLKWMVEKEHPREPEEEGEPVQLWTKFVEDDEAQYYNLGTRQTTARVPAFKRGGILADDMGLGKTLTMLALIRSDLTGRGVIDHPDETVDNFFCKATLIICPPSVISNWREQMRAHIGRANQIQYHVYHGKETQIPKNALKECDVVITTYQMVAGEFRIGPDGPVGKKRKKNQECDEELKNGKLFQIPWRRVVLDEGHIVRNPKTRAARAVFKLKAERRWVLTGTPLINKPQDLGTLITFLKVCKPFNDSTDWSKYIGSKLRKGQENASASNLLQAIMSSVALRRTKEMRDADGKPLIQLPEIKFHTFKITLDQKARAIYDLAAQGIKERVENMILDGEVAKNFTNILTLLLRLRQLACATPLCPRAFLETLENAQELQKLEIDPNVATLSKERKAELQQILFEARNEDCSICHDTMPDPRITPCSHIFCLNCITEWLQKNAANGCPMCRSAVTEKSLLEIPESIEKTDQENFDRRQDDGGGLAHAQKAKELIRLIKLYPGTKSLVFSQWTSHLRYLADCLDDEGIEWVQLDGSLKLEERDEAIESFRRPNGPTVFLLTLGTGAVGLNLTVATNVFLMDPWWQGQIEHQAIDRAYRIGQTEPVRVFQIVAENTVEDRVLTIQKNKEEMIKAAFAGTQGAVMERPKHEARFADLAQLLGVDVTGIIR